jgi:large subunit ribosomal protein L1
VELVSSGQSLPFDVLLATPKTVSMFRQHGRILGPKGLMPNEKQGTIVEDFSTYGTKEEKGIELKSDAPGKSSRGAMVRVAVGKVSAHHSSLLINQSSSKTITPSKQT